MSKKRVFSGLTHHVTIFDADFWNTFYDQSRSPANRTITPKNVKTNKQMNFTVSTLLIWTRYKFRHIFFFLERLDIFYNIKVWRGIGAWQEEYNAPMICENCQQNANMTVKE